MDGKLLNMTSVYISKGSKMLLLYRQGGRVVNDVWVGSAGGHFEKDELSDAKACALRELYEELGMTGEEIRDMRLRYITLRHTKGEIRLNYYFFAELADGFDRDIQSNEGVSGWFELSELKDLKMPYTAGYVMDHYLTMGMHSDKLYVGVADGSGVVFTEMPET